MAIHKHNADEIATLLHIHEKAHAHGNLPNITASALARLKEINDDMATTPPVAPVAPTPVQEPTQEPEKETIDE